MVWIGGVGFEVLVFVEGLHGVFPTQADVKPVVLGSGTRLVVLDGPPLGQGTFKLNWRIFRRFRVFMSFRQERTSVEQQEGEIRDFRLKATLLTP